MKIKSIHLQNFKRFTDLKIQNIPPTAKLVVLLGPNGCGKSSLFDALHYKSYEYRRLSTSTDLDYYSKTSAQRRQIDLIDVKFHDDSQSDKGKAIYVRTAYRNDPVLNIGAIQTMPSVIKETRFRTMIENDAAVTGNYQRLVSNAVESAFNREDRLKTLGEFQDEILGEIQAAMIRLFPDLVLNSLGNPLTRKVLLLTRERAKNFFIKISLVEKSLLLIYSLIFLLKK